MNTMLTSLTLAAVATLSLAGAAEARRQQGMVPQTTIPQTQVGVIQALGTPLPCVATVPVEFPSMRITNTTGQAIAAGRRVSYNTTNGLHDTLTLSSAVAAGATFYGPSAEAPYTCTATLLP